MSLGEIICYFAVIYLTVLLLCHISRRIKFYVKLILYYFAIFSVTTVAIPFSLLQPGDPGNLLYASWMVHHIISPAFGLKWDVKNKELLNSKEPCVFVCNHQSALDISGMMYIWPLFHPCVPVLKKELLYSGPFGIFCWLCDCVFVDRCNSAEAYKILNKKIIAMKDKKVKLWIFPEGTRNDKGTLLPFKKGAFHIATQTKVPIVPIVFSHYTDFYSISKKIFDRGTITVTVLPWITTEHLTASDVPSLTEEVRSIMLASLSKSTENTNEENSNYAEISTKNKLIT